MTQVLSNPTVTDGIRKFLRLQSLPVAETQLKWTADVFDLVEAVSVLAQSFKDTAPMVGHQMYQMTKYTPGEDVKRALEEFLLYGEDERTKALYRKKNLTMYHLVLEPIIDTFSTTSHEHVLTVIDTEATQVVDYVMAFTDYGNEDDALVARHQVKQMVKRREDARREQKLAAKRGSRKKVDKTLLEDVDIDPAVDIDIDD